MSTGLIALLDDVVSLAKVAAASLDDVAAQAAKAGSKAAGVVIDDAAVTPRYVVGFAANRELPIVRKIAMGSLRNKLLFLLPAALTLSLVAPWAITPLLMLGGAYLCFEGAEKIHEAVWPHDAHGGTAGAAPESAPDAASLEDSKVSGAIKTDFILSAEIMAITLASIPGGNFWIQAAVLAGVGIGITVAVYGAVALIVKADDVGVALAGSARPASAVLGVLRRGASAERADAMLRPLTQAIGRGLVLGMPPFLKLLSLVGTAAMVWVGGGILIHGLEEYGLPGIAHAIHGVAAAGGQLVPSAAAAMEWLIGAAGAGLIGVVVGGVIIAVVQFGTAPALRRLAVMRR